MWFDPVEVGRVDERQDLVVLVLPRCHRPEAPDRSTVDRVGAWRVSARSLPGGVNAFY